MALRHGGMLEVNEFLVLDFIREHQETTRPEIGHELGLSASSVSRLVARLVREGLVVESGGSPTSAGRPRGRIVFNRRAGAVVAVDLGGTRCHGALADLGGDLIAEDERASGVAADAFAALLASIETLRTIAAARGLPVVAVAVGIPAIIDPGTGRALGGPRVDWQGFEIVQRLDAALDLPYTLDNDVNLAALGHAWRGDARGVADFLVMSVGTGIGGAVVADGRLVKGHHNAGGELGYVTVSGAQLDVPLERGLGGLEAVASGPAIARRARERVAAAGARQAGASRLAGKDLTPELVFAAAADGDDLAARTIAEAVEALSLALTAAAATVDPAVVILEGGVGRSLGPYLPVIRARLAARLPAPPAVVVSGLQSASVLGAVAAALQLARERRAPGPLSGAILPGRWVTTAQDARRRSDGTPGMPIHG